MRKNQGAWAEYCRALNEAETVYERALSEIEMAYAAALSSVPVSEQVDNRP